MIVTYIQGNRIAAHAVDTALSTSTAVQKEIEQSRLDQLQLKLQQIAADPSTVKYVSQASGATNNLPGLSESSDTDTKSIPDLLKERQTQFAFDLGIAEATVKAHMTALMRKLNVRNRTQLAIAAQAFRQGDREPRSALVA